MKESITWITGASTGIGKELALKYLREKYRVVLSSRSILKYRNEYSDYGDNALFEQFDISALEESQNAFNNISENNTVDCLINNAGITVFKSVVDTSAEEINKIVNTNLIGTINLIKLVLPGMIERKSGTIINILSVAAETTFTNSGIYSASKAGLQAFAKVLREEVREHNIRVVNVYPGATKTPIWQKNIIERHGERMMNPEDLSKLIFDSTRNSSAVVEELVVRPVLGDL